MNCLAYALRFWDKHPHYKIYYNSDHAVNSMNQIGGGYLPAEDYGYAYFNRAFNGLLSKDEQILLKKYFNLT